MMLCIPFIIAYSKHGSIAIENHFIALVKDPRSIALLIFNPNNLRLSSTPSITCRPLDPAYRDLETLLKRAERALDELKHRMLREGTKSFRRLRLGLIAPLIHRFVKVPSSDVAMAITVLEHCLGILKSRIDYDIKWLELEITVSGNRISASVPEIEARFSWLYENDEGFRKGVESVVVS